MEEQIQPGQLPPIHEQSPNQKVTFDKQGFHYLNPGDVENLDNNHQLSSERENSFMKNDAQDQMNKASPDQPIQQRPQQQEDQENQEEQSQNLCQSKLNSFLLMFSTEPVQTGIFHNGEQEFKTSVGGLLNMLSLLFLLAYTIYVLTKTFKKQKWNLEIEQGENLITSFGELEVNFFLRFLNITVTSESSTLDFLGVELEEGGEDGKQLFIDYYGCMTDPYEQYEYTYSLYTLSEDSYDDSLEDEGDTWEDDTDTGTDEGDTGNDTSTEDGTDTNEDDWFYEDDDYYVEDFYDIECLLGDLDTCYDIEDKILNYDKSQCKTPEAIVCDFFVNHTSKNLYGKVFQYFEGNESVNISRVSNGKVNKNTIDKVTIQNRSYPLDFDIESCSIVGSIIYATFGLGNHSMESEIQETFNEETYEYTFSSVQLNATLKMEDLNITYDRPFMGLECEGCLAMALDYLQLVTTSEGVKSYLSRTEAPFGDAGYKTEIRPLEYEHTENVFNAFFENETLADIQDPILDAIYFENMLENSYSYYDIEEAVGAFYTWDFYIGRKKSQVKAWPYSIWDAFAEIGGIASFLGIIAIVIAMINERLFMKDLRESVLPEHKQREKGCWATFKRSFFPTEQDVADQEEISRLISFKELYYATKTFTRMRERSALFKQMIQECEDDEKKQKMKEA